MAEAKIVEDLQNLSGTTVYDAEGHDLGKIQHVYGLGKDDLPMWITLNTSEGLASKRLVFVPMARVKDESGELRIPYSRDHLQDSPEVEAGDELSAEDDRALRDYYAIDLGDHEQRTDNVSYAAQVPEGDGPATRIAGDN